MVALSGYLPLSSKFKEIAQETNKQTPILMCHGVDDDVVQYSWGRSSFELLKNNSFNVDFKSYRNMGHSASQNELMDVVKFLKNNL